MSSKEQRQKRIQEIIAREHVSTQSELVERLLNERVRVTQATVSRDINELRIARIPDGKGRHRYSIAPLAMESDVLDELRRRFREFTRDIDRGENIIVVRTAEGHATGVAYLLDRLNRDDIVGTLAGQDTILIICRTTREATQLQEDLHEMIV